MINLLSNSRRKTRSILVKMFDLHHLGRKHDDIISFDFETLTGDTGIKHVELGKILLQLKEKKIIKDIHTPFPDVFEKGIDDLYYITVPKNFRDVVEKYIERLSDQEIDNSGIIIYLDSDGNLWHGNKEQNCYPMGSTKGRFMIVRHLASNKGFQSTDIISSILGGKDKQNTRNEISKIRNKISFYLKIDDLIESKKDSGYRINPKYKIVTQ